MDGRSQLKVLGLMAGIALLAGCGGDGAKPPSSDRAGGSLSTSAVNSYEGPLVETHAHIVPYQSLEQTEVQYRVEASERASELSVASYVSSLDRNKIKCTVGFHGIAFDNKEAELLAHARRLLILYPDRFILFAEIFRHNPLDWFDASKLRPLLSQGVFRGLGEIQFANLPLGDVPSPVRPDDKDIFLPIYRVLGDLGLFVMAHPGPAQRGSVQNAVRHDPRVTWLTHGPQLHSSWTRISGPDSLESLLRNNYPQVYYTVDIAESLPEFLALMKRFDPQSGGEFLKVMNRDFDKLLDRMVDTWKDVIDRNPDRFMWGTDMALPTWQWRASVFDMIVKFSRAFIGRLDPATQEKFAYKNAEKLLGDCKYSADVPVPIDIKPGSFPNSIDPTSSEIIPIAILSSPRLDAPRQVDPSSLTFGRTGDEASLASCNEESEDVNGDGLPDLTCYFSAGNANFQSGDKKGILKGKTKGKRTIEGRDWVRIIP